jgi:hypothetical protein
MLDKQNLRITSNTMLLAVAAADDDEEGEHDNVKDAAKNNKQQDKNLVTALRMKIKQGTRQDGEQHRMPMRSRRIPALHDSCSLLFVFCILVGGGLDLEK